MHTARASDLLSASCVGMQYTPKATKSSANAGTDGVDRIEFPGKPARTSLSLSAAATAEPQSWQRDRQSPT